MCPKIDYAWKKTDAFFAAQFQYFPSYRMRWIICCARDLGPWARISCPPPWLWCSSPSTRSYRNGTSCTCTWKLYPSNRPSSSWCHRWRARMPFLPQHQTAQSRTTTRLQRADKCTEIISSHQMKRRNINVSVCCERWRQQCLNPTTRGNKTHQERKWFGWDQRESREERQKECREIYKFIACDR